MSPSQQIVFAFNEVAAGARITGSLTITGGGNEIRCWALDPDGNTILNLGTVTRQQTFEFTTTKNGVYLFRFDNTGSTSQKIVEITYSEGVPEHPFPLGLWLPIITMVLIVILIGLPFIRKKRQSHQDVRESRV